MNNDGLPSDLWCSIGSMLDAASDRSRFRAVCKTWNSMILSCQPPWLMLAESQPRDNDNITGAGQETLPPPPRGFVRLGEQKVYEFQCPELHRGRCVGSIGTWVSVIYLDKSICLVNPFSRVLFHLPSVLTFGILMESYLGPDLECCRDELVSKIVLSSPPAAKAKDCIAVALYNYRMLTFARPGDADWTDLPWNFDAVHDMIFFRKKLYVINFWGRLVVCDIQGDDPQLTLLTDTFLEPTSTQVRVRYLVECSGELLQVVKLVQEEQGNDSLYKTTRFQVYKFDFTVREFSELKSLGEHSLFLGHNTSTSLLASDYSGVVKKNCIYFTDDFMVGFTEYGTEVGYDMGIFNLEDKSITPHFEGISTSIYSPPIWIIPA